MTQLDLLTYPNHAGWKSRDTSQAAAVAVEPKAKVIREKIVALLQTGFRGNSWAIAEAIGEHVDNVKPRCTELSKPQINLVRDSGTTSLNPNNKPCVVWEICNE